MNGSSAERLSKLWYIPHITQILVGMARPDKPHKGPIDLNGLVYKNGQAYNRSFKVHSLIQEIFTLVSSISYLLVGNQKYSAAGETKFPLKSWLILFLYLYSIWNPRS